jgi:hypothetical protein
VEEKQTTTEGFMDFFRGKKTNKEEVANQLTSLIIPTGKLTGNMANSAIKSINTFNSIMKNIEASDKKLFDELSRIAENLAPDEFGRNRSTEDNGIASFDNLYLGNVSGLFTKSLDFWVDSAKTNAEVATIIGNQLSRWVNSNINAAIKKLSDNNKNTNESKMKRLKFKKPFNGVDTALKVIPESYKVDNRVFELTDGNEHYSVRWEGSVTEGKGVVLSSFHQEALNEDVAKIKHLMGFKSQDTLGNLKGGQRLTEDNTFFDMLNKSKALNEAEAKPDFLDLDGDGDKEEPMKKASKEAHHEKSIEEADVAAGGAQPPQNLKNDVEMLFNTLSKNGNLVNKINKINNPIEKSQFLVKVSELIGLDLNLFSKTVQQMKSQAKQQEQVGENSYLKKK